MMMKKTFKFLTLAMLLSFVGTVSALAQAIKGTTQWADDVQYEITAIRVLNGSVKEATVSVIDNATPKSGVTEVTIPGKVTLKVSGKTDNSVTVSAMDVEFTVTKIEKFGYANKNDVQKFNIPAEVEEIGADAFHNAASQTNTDLQIVFAAGSKLKKIGDCAFGNSAAKTIDLSNCNDLDLTGSKPFVNRGTGENNQLQKVILPEGIQNIGQAFAGLPKLTELDLSNTKVTVLEDGALANTGLTEVTIPAVTEPTVQTVKIGSKAFENSPIEKLTINAPIATQGAIASDAFYGMPKLKEVNFNGDLLVAGAVPENAFKDSPLEKVKFNKVATGAISAEAFKGQDKLNSVSFNGDVEAGAIGASAFAGIATAAADCATVVFRKNLTGEAAIGEKAFDGAAIKILYFKGNLADKAISTLAFNEITCDAAVRFEGTLGAQAIGENAFNKAELQYVLFALAIDQEKAIDEYAFNEATIIGSDKFAVRFGGALNAQHSIGTRAFYLADIQKDIIFAGDIAGKEAISSGAFSGFDNSLGGGVPVLFSGNISGEKAIGEYAFQGGAVSTVTINGNVSGLNAISDFAFLYCGNNTSSADAVYTMTSLVIKGEVSNTNAIGYQAFAGNLNLALIDLQGNIYAATAPAIAPEAFAYVGKNSGKLVVNFGPIKSSQAIFGAEAPAPSSRSMIPSDATTRLFGAFYGAVIDVVNFDKLMAEKAIADFQFGGATINTVNFNAEFKAWPEAQNNAAENFVGWNAFTGTKVNTVNFNAAISVPFAIYAAPKAERKATSFNATYAAQSPFAENGAPMTINFNADVVENGIGAYAFSNSNTVAINLANGADFGMRAFRNWSFYGITWDGTAEKHVDINYDAPTGVTDRSFAQGAFYGSTDIVDIYFNTTKEVLNLYTAENNASDLTPYRIKGIATKYIDVIQGPDGTYTGVFTPENEMYIIEKYQESGAQVGVWSAYADDLTLEATGEQFKANGRDKYKADLYINPLRVQDKGKYVLNAGHTLIITSSTADKVIAKQDLGAHVNGGVQTFAGLSPWACNDLRWNPAESNSNNWGGYVNWAAIDNGDKDIYGNTVRDYELFRQYDFATQGLGFGNSINIPEDQMYILVASLGANQIANRIKYSEYGNNAEWFETNGISWEKSVAELIADAVAAAEAGESGATEKYNNLIKKLQEAAADEDGNPSTTTDEDELIEEVMNKIIDQHLSDNAELKSQIKTLADELLPLVKDYAKALCDLRNAKEAVERTNRIPAEAAEELELTGTFSDNLDAINAIKEEAEATIAELDEYLTVAAGDEQGDDMYKKYLALKALYAGDTEAKELLEEYNALPANVQRVVSNNSRTTAQIKALGDDKDAVYYPFRNKYVAWAGQDATNNFQFDLDVLTAAAEAVADPTDDELDALFYTSDLNIDKPSTFKKGLEEAAEEAEEIAELYKDYEDAMEAIEENSDVHSLAAFNNILWAKRPHYTLTIWSGIGQYAEVVNTYDVTTPYTSINNVISTEQYIEIDNVRYSVMPFVIEGDYLTSDRYGVIEGAYGTDESSIIQAKQIVRWNSNDYKWEQFDGADYATLLTTSDVQEYLPYARYKNAAYDNAAFEALYPNKDMVAADDLYDGDINILQVNAANLSDESLRCYNLLKSVKGLLDNGFIIPTEYTGSNYVYQYDGPWYADDEYSYVTWYELDTDGIDDDAEAAEAAAEAARAAANNWVLAWYAQANEIPGSTSSMHVTFVKEVEKLAAQEVIAEADAQLAILMAIEDPYDGESACQKYLDAVEALGTPAVEDDEETADVDETAAATGAYLAVDEAKEAKDAKVEELKAVVNGIEVSEARLNIVWNDGSDNVVGIMEAVVNRTATEGGSNAIYNLNGMRVKNAQKGIFIQNGKKVIK